MPLCGARQQLFMAVPLSITVGLPSTGSSGRRKCCSPAVLTHTWAPIESWRVRDLWVLWRMQKRQGTMWQGAGTARLTRACTMTFAGCCGGTRLAVVDGCLTSWLAKLHVSVHRLSWA